MERLSTAATSCGSVSERCMSSVSSSAVVFAMGLPFVFLSVQAPRGGTHAYVSGRGSLGQHVQVPGQRLSFLEARPSVIPIREVGSKVNRTALDETSVRTSRPLNCRKWH